MGNWTLRKEYSLEESATGKPWPRGYGITYYSHVKDVWVLHPVPLNAVIRYTGMLYERLRFPKITAGEARSIEQNQVLEIKDDLKEANRAILQLQKRAESAEAERDAYRRML